MFNLYGIANRGSNGYSNDIYIQFVLILPLNIQRVIGECFHFYI